jgi:predicted metal-dependent phosphoesterase TrpH
VIDLHSHSTASDGSLSPTALVALARERGLKALALTDHDTTAGLPEAEAAAAALEALPDGSRLRLIRGVEIEVAFEPGEFHLLGLDLGPLYGADGSAAGAGARRLLAALEGLGRARDTRNSLIVDKAREAGIDITMEELALTAAGSRAGRPHIASLLVAHKAARNRQDAFDRYLAKGRPLYVAKECIDLAEAIDLVHGAGGLAIVAHPLSLFVSWTRLSGLMDGWKEAGIDGIEAYHPVAKLGQCRRLERMGRERGFRVTAGSDYHGNIRPERRLGKTSGGLVIEDSVLSELDR